MTSFEAPTSCNLSKSTITQLAENFATSIGYVPGEDMLPIVQKLGGKISYLDFWDLQDGMAGSIQVQGKGNFEIFLPLHTGSERDRFTIAHELGHYVLHYLLRLAKDEPINPIIANRYGEGQVEYEANWFASSFLMPETAFRKAFEENNNFFALAERFNVSFSAAKIRAAALHLN